MAVADQHSNIADQRSKIKAAKQALLRFLPKRARFGLNASRARYLRVYEPELRLVGPLCDRRLGSIDVGAMNGHFTFFMEWTSAWVAAYEPHPILFRQLCGAFGPTVKVMPYAISDRSGTTPLMLPHWEGKDQLGCATLEAQAPAHFEPRTITVETRTIDELDLGKIGFMKISAEGHELAILRGARAKILSDRPNMIVALQNRLKPGLREDAIAWLAGLDYDGFFIRNMTGASTGQFSIRTFHPDRTLHPVRDFVPDLQRPEHALQPDGSQRGEYVWKFVFVHRSRPEVIDRLGRRMSRWFHSPGAPAVSPEYCFIFFMVGFVP